MANKFLEAKKKGGERDHRPPIREVVVLPHVERPLVKLYLEKAGSWGTSTAWRIEAGLLFLAVFSSPIPTGIVK